MSSDPVLVSRIKPVNFHWSVSQSIHPVAYNERRGLDIKLLLKSSSTDALYFSFTSYRLSECMVPLIPQSLGGTIICWLKLLSIIEASGFSRHWVYISIVTLFFLFSPFSVLFYRWDLASYLWEDSKHIYSIKYSSFKYMNVFPHNWYFHHFHHLWIHFCCVFFPCYW